LNQSVHKFSFMKKYIINDSEERETVDNNIIDTFGTTGRLNSSKEETNCKLSEPAQRNNREHCTTEFVSPDWGKARNFMSWGCWERVKCRISIPLLHCYISIVWRFFNWSKYCEDRILLRQQKRTREDQLSTAKWQVRPSYMKLNVRYQSWRNEMIVIWKWPLTLRLLKSTVIIM